MFRPEQRNIFRYWNGHKVVLADPRKILTKFQLEYPAGSTLEHDFKLLQLEKPEEALRAFDRIVSSARNALGLAELGQDDDGNPVGVTDEEAMMILTEFGLYVDDVKKNTVVTPSLPKSTESESSNGEDNPNTSATSGSGSIETKPSTASV